MGFLDRFLKKPAEATPKKVISPIQSPKAVSGVPAVRSGALAKATNAEALRVDIKFDSRVRTSARTTAKECEAPPITAFTEVKAAYGFRAFVKHRTDGVDEAIIYFCPSLWTRRDYSQATVQEIKKRPYMLYRLDSLESLDEVMDQFAPLVPGLNRFPKEERKVTKYAV